MEGRSNFKFRNAMRIYVVTDERIEGPVISMVLTSSNIKYVLLNDKPLGRLRIVLRRGHLAF